MVCFACANLHRNEGKGVASIISFLLALMGNQIEAAQKAGLKFEMLNSSKNEE